MPVMNFKDRHLHYIDRGQGYPILFGHSFLWDSCMWLPQIDALSQHYRCIAVDLWDHGQSSQLQADTYTIAQLAEDYWQFMQQLGFHEFAIVGLSVGGMWGVQMTLDHPKAISALVIMDTYVGAEPKATQAQYLGMLANMVADQGISAELAAGIAPLFFSPKTAQYKPEMIQTLKNQLIALPGSHIAGIAALGQMIFTRDCLLDRLSEIQQPTLVMVGEDDIPRPPAEAKEMAKRLPNSQLIIIKEAGHIANLEQPEQVTKALFAFLATEVVAESGYV